MRPARLAEFFIIGVCLGIIEDIIAVKASTGIMITWQTIWIIILIALPFAIISELIVDHFKPFHRKKKKRK